MDGEHHRHFIQSPLIIGLIGVGAGAIVVATYQCLVNSCCFIQSRIAQQSRSEQTQVLPTTTNSNGTTRMTISINPSPVHMLPISRYNKERKESTCAVCLSEFTDGEAIRVLPECAHLFHVGCIDMWLQSHSNCPLCRTDIVPVPRRQQVTFERMEPLTYSDPNSFIGVIPERHVTLERIELPITMNSNPSSFSQPRPEQHVLLMPHLGVN